MQDTRSQDIMSIISLLAGAAQHGAKGILAQAAYNLMMASEAVAKAKKFQVDEKLQQAAQAALQEAQQSVIRISNMPEALEEAKQDIIQAQQQPYDPTLKK